MKRFLALLTVLSLLFSAALAQNVQPEGNMVEEGSACGVTIWRNHQEIKTDSLQTVLDYPSFECGDAAFAQLLEESITAPILEMAMLEDGQVRGGFYASLDFEGVLSVEASVHKLPEDEKETQVELFYAVVDLNGKRLLSLGELFTEPEPVVQEVICNAVYEQASALGILLGTITNSGLVPLPDSCYLTENALRVTYAPGALCA